MPKGLYSYNKVLITSVIGLALVIIAIFLFRKVSKRRETFKNKVEKRKPKPPKPSPRFDGTLYFYVTEGLDLSVTIENLTEALWKGQMKNIAIHPIFCQYCEITENGDWNCSDGSCWFQEVLYWSSAPGKNPIIYGKSISTFDKKTCNEIAKWVKSTA